MIWGGGVNMVYALNFETSVEESRLFPTRLLAVRETYHNLLDIRYCIELLELPTPEQHL